MAMAGGVELIRSFEAPAQNPGKLCWGGELLWLVDHASQAILGLDPEVGTVESTLHIRREVGGIACVGEEIWLVDPSSRLLQKMDRFTGEITSHLALPETFSPYGGISVNSDKLWIGHTQAGHLLEISMIDGAVLRQLEVEAHVSDLGWSAPYLYLLDQSRAQLLRLDPLGSRLAPPFGLTGNPQAFCQNGNDFWVYDADLKQINQLRLLR